MIGKTRLDRRGLDRPPAHAGDAEVLLANFAKAGVDIVALAAKLQDDGAKAFVKSWDELMGVISAKSAALKMAS